ncbi:YcxB family protein [Clostridium cylindrosporum]|uniref:YcxB-like C-terminal domain-containing protein n=1 Tax=Clostridium cylindrosporum DSM 605 TaxID=1121307 RepID=A0A0J8D735_CLOCY|nr:YcxB family protein [Clostridium cylindrosporum]KMT21880.1 hypothetical protein CLCY_3c01510 [Clostridium cylindrosporum DSM 605]
MDINYELTKQDFIDFNIFHMSYSSTFKKVLFIQRYILPLIFFVVPFIIASMSNVPLLYWIIAALLGYLLWANFYPRLLKRIMAKKISEMIDEGKSAEFLGSRRLILNDDGIIGSSEHNESKTDWSSVGDVVETKSHIFIYIDSVSAHIVPIREFKNAEEKSKFIEKIECFKNKNKA